MLLQKLYQKVPELEKSTAVAVEKMRLEEAARRKLEERLITVSHQPKDPTSIVPCITCNHASTVIICVYTNWGSNYACTACIVHETTAPQSGGTQAASAQHWGVVHHVW